MATPLPTDYGQRPPRRRLTPHQRRGLAIALAAVVLGVVLQWFHLLFVSGHPANHLPVTIIQQVGTVTRRLPSQFNVDAEPTWVNWPAVAGIAGLAVWGMWMALVGRTTGGR